MALDMTPEQKAIGKDNFHRVIGRLAEDKPGVTRRRFLKGPNAAGPAAAAPVGAAAYFGYGLAKDGSKAPLEKPVRAALIGAGDEGGVLIGEHNPGYLEFVAVCDIRPSNRKRIFTGDLAEDPKTKEKVPRGWPRLGFNNIAHYGPDSEGKKIKVFDDYRKLLEDKELGIEAVVIALPLHLHAPMAIACMEAGKHVLCEKLMAWNVTQCKDMIKAADKTDRVLAIGHQRHYSMLYAHTVELINTGVLGDINHIRAL